MRNLTSEHILQILESAMDAVICTDAHGVIFIFNSAAEHIFGHQREAVIGKDLSMLIPQRYRAGHPSHMRNFGQTNSTSRKMGKLGQIFGLRADGTEVPLEASISQIDSANGKIFTAILRDISERRKYELALTNSEHRLRAILDNMTEGYQIVGFDWRYKYFNQAFVSHSRYSAEELMAGTVIELYPGIEKAPVFAAYEKCFRDRVVIRMENEFRFPDGSVGWFDLFFQPVEEGLSILSVDITKRKLQEIALREKEKQLSEIIRISGTGSFELDISTGILHGSDQWRRILGLAPDVSVRREDFRNLIHPEDRTRIMEASGNAIAHLKVFSEEFRLVRPNGEIHWVFVNSEGRRDHEGRVRYGGSIIDITALKSSEENLKQSEERFRQVVENIEEVFWMTDVVKQTILYISPAYEKVWGRSIASLHAEPLTWLDAIHPDDRARVREATRRQADGIYNEEYRIVQPNGNVRWISDRAFPVRDAHGNVYRVAGVAVDITEKKKLQQELTRFIELSPVVIYALRLENNRFIPSWHAQNLITLTGFSPDESMNETWWIDNIHPEDRQRVLDANPVPFEIEQQVLEYRFRKKSGSYIWIRDEKRLVRDAQGKPAEIVGSWSDITERVQLEAQMRHAQKMEAIGQLAAGVAHDFNNLLTVIGGNNSLIAQWDGLPREVLEWSGDIKLAAEKAAYLTKQLLLVGRRQSLELKAVDLNESLRQALSLLQRTLGADIDARLQLAPVELNVYADPGMLSQVLLNLGVNARDAMPKGGILSLESEVRELDEATAHSIPGARPGVYARVSVSDTGGGIPKEIIPRIFEPFFTTKEFGKGTGLGLATVFGIIQQHRGWINVYSETGHGTTFRIYLPLVQALQNKEVRPAPGEMFTGSETVLVVEDQIPLRKMATTMLTKLGYHVLEAGTGKEALVVWESYQDQIRIILTDVIMPDGMSGFELGRQLHERKSNVKIIFTSGYTPELMKIERPLTEGLNFLAKPYALADLSRIIRKALDTPSFPTT